MSLEKYRRARELITKAGGGDFAGPRPEALVARAEAALGLRFPPSYRQFLLDLGAGDVGGFEVYGIIDDDFADARVPDAIALTLDAIRARVREQLGLFHSGVKRFLNPHRYPVGLESTLHERRTELILAARAHR